MRQGIGAIVLTVVDLDKLASHVLVDELQEMIHRLLTERGNVHNHMQGYSGGYII